MHAEEILWSLFVRLLADFLYEVSSARHLGRWLRQRLWRAAKGAKPCRWPAPA